MARRRPVDRSARPNPLKAEVALHWKVQVTKDGEVQVTDVATIPASDTSKKDIVGFCAVNKVKLVSGHYALRFGVHNGMSEPEYPKELEVESLMNLVTAFIPELAITVVSLSTEYARFPSDEEIREGAEGVVAAVFNRLVPLPDENGVIPVSMDYSLLRPGFISVVGAECVECMGLRGQKMPTGETLHKFLAVYNSDGVSFGNGMAKIGFDTGKCVVMVGYRHAVHGFVFARFLNVILARRFAKLLAEVECELLAEYSRDTFKLCTDTVGFLSKVADGYGFSLTHPQL